MIVYLDLENFLKEKNISKNKVCEAWNNNPSTSLATGKQSDSVQTVIMQTDPIPETQATEPVTEAQPVGMYLTQVLHNHIYFRRNGKKH